MNSKTHIAGRLAFLDGLKLTDNPNRSKRMRTLWRAGWLEAHAEQADNQRPIDPTPESKAIAARLASWARENLGETSSASPRADQGLDQGRAELVPPAKGTTP